MSLTTSIETLIQQMRDAEPLVSQLGIHAKHVDASSPEVDSALEAATAAIATLIDTVDRANLQLQRVRYSRTDAA